MNSSTVWISVLIGAGAIVSACDRKSEASTEAETTNAAESHSVTSTTVGLVGEVAEDAGADGGEAGTTVVAVSVTTIAVQGKAEVVEGIADARCQRELRCGNVGTGKAHLSMEACRIKIATDWRDDLNRYECPGGINQKELNECVEEIKNEDCKNPFDKLERVIACRSGDICISTR